MARGTLRLYLGAAPGVGKTYAMLNEGWRRKERGTDVVVGWVQDHGRPHTDAQLRDLEVFPRRTARVPGPDVRGDGRGRPGRPPARSSSWSTNSPIPTFPGRSMPSVGRTSRNSSMRASMSSRRSTCSISNRSTTSSSRSPGSPSRRRSPTRWCGPPTRSNWSTWLPRPCVGGWRTATSTPPSASTPRWRTTSAPATSPPCGSWPSCGWPTESTRSSTTTGSATASPARGRPRSAWWSRSPAHAAVPSSSGGPPGWPCGPKPSWSGCTSGPTTP